MGEDNPKSATWKKLRGYKAKGKCFGEVASEVKELAEKAANEEDVRERLAMEVFLGAIPCHFAREIRVKWINSLKEALQEAKLHKEVTEDLRPARQEAGQKAKENRKGRREPVCWGCGETGHVLKNCKLWKEFKKGKQKSAEVEVNPELN